MGFDLHIIWETKEKGIWVPNRIISCDGYECKDSALHNNFMPLVLHHNQLCSWYTKEKITPIHYKMLGAPNDYLGYADEKIWDWFSKEELENFSWDRLRIPYDIAVCSESLAAWESIGYKGLPEDFCSFSSSNDYSKIQFEKQFSDIFPEVITELSMMKKIPEYRMLTYYS